MATLRSDLARLREEIAQVRRAVPEPKPESPPVTDPFLVAAVQELRGREAEWEARIAAARTSGPGGLLGHPGSPPPDAQRVWLARECWRRLCLLEGQPEPFPFEAWPEVEVRDGVSAAVPMPAGWAGRPGPSAGSAEDQAMLERLLRAQQAGLPQPVEELSDVERMRRLHAAGQVNQAARDGRR
jgi:hypothetical protein